MLLLPYYVFDLPVNRRKTVFFQIFVCSGKRMAAEKIHGMQRADSDERTSAPDALDCGSSLFFRCAGRPPEDKDHRSILLCEYLDRCIGKLFPADFLVGICLMRTYSQHRVQH